VLPELPGLTAKPIELTGRVVRCLKL
jgi:hypothetical protein